MRRVTIAIAAAMLASIVAATAFAATVIVTTVNLAPEQAAQINCPTNLRVSFSDERPIHTMIVSCDPTTTTPNGTGGDDLHITQHHTEGPQTNTSTRTNTASATHTDSNTAPRGDDCRKDRKGHCKD